MKVSLSAALAAATALAIGLGCADGGTTAGTGAPAAPASPVPPPPPPSSVAAPSCTPATCANLPAGSCGTLQDPCTGALLGCGDCGAGVVCRDLPWIGDGVCTLCNPLFRTCADVGFACGMQVNGCGDVLHCGECPAGEACGGAGVLGTCGRPPAATASWVVRLGMRLAGFDPSMAITALPDGSALVLGWRGTDPALRLERVEAEGASLVRAFAMSGFAMVTMRRASGGSLLLQVGAPADGAPAAVVDLGGGPHVAPYVAELRTDGTFVRDLCAADRCDASILDADAHGNALAAEVTPQQRTVSILRADGRRVLLLAEDSSRARSGPLAGSGCTAATFTTDGFVACASSVPGPVELGFWTELGRNPSIAKVDLDGRVLWSRTVPGIWVGWAASIASTCDGGAVAAGTFIGFARFGPDVLDFRAYGPVGGGAGFILTFAADGTPRRARQTQGEVWTAEVAPDGRVAAVVRGELGPYAAVAYGADGQLGSSWSLRPPLRGTEYYPASVAVGPDALFIATGWEGDYAFGPGATGTAERGDVLLIRAPF